ncbi:MAG: biotin/lipoyl-binding protein, partial [Synechococcaceae cyanobacterium]|nr:biotin/lipoyl-binding protein [Synechococcaceae cyanobacterium]
MAASRPALGVIPLPNGPLGQIRGRRLARHITGVGPSFHWFSQRRTERWRPSRGGAALVAALTCTALLGACRNQPQAQARPPLSVQTESAQVARFGDVLNTVSTLEALGEVNVATQAGGRILRLYVRQGDVVRPGQPLLVLDQTQTRADVARLEAEAETKKL